MITMVLLISLVAYFSIYGITSSTADSGAVLQVNRVGDVKSSGKPYAEVLDFSEFAMRFKDYTTIQERVKRERIYTKNIEYIRAHNRRFDNGEVTFRLGINEFADMTNSEFRKHFMLGKIQQLREKKQRRRRSPSIFQWQCNTNVYTQTTNSETPASVDWVTADKVSSVKNQGQCGDCWSFAATAAVEGAYAIHEKNTAVSLSEQQLLDCSSTNKGFGNCGCNGGFAQNAFHYLIKLSGGIQSYDSYPYTGTQHSCSYNSADKVTGITSCTVVQEGSESSLQQAVASYGPTAVGIDASSMSFQLYSSGVYYNPTCSSKNLDHAVLVAGYGSESDGGEYWIVKNSWGTSWGESGYIKMARNKNNNCGIATDASFVQI